MNGWPALPDLWARLQARRLHHHPGARGKPLTPGRAKALKRSANAVHAAGYTVDQLVGAVDWLYTSTCYTAECCRDANGGDPVVALLRSERGKGEMAAVLYVEASLDEQADAIPAGTGAKKSALEMALDRAFADEEEGDEPHDNVIHMECHP